LTILLGQTWESIALITKEISKLEDRKQVVVINETIGSKRKHWKIVHINLL
jgi:hypothetical protein